MKAEKVVIALGIFLVAGCHQKQDKLPAPYENEVAQLQTADDKRMYLEQIFEDDQNVRNPKEETAIISKYGYGSTEHRALADAQMQQDEINLLKIEAYLEKHGYPDKSMGEYATTVPWVVIHHSAHYEARAQHFATVYAAYLKGDIKDGAISLYLGRMYEMKHGERLNMEGSYKTEDHINVMIEALYLEDQKLEAQERL